MRVASIVIASALWMCIDCNADAHEATTACRPHAEAIQLAATEQRVPVLLLTALVFSESSCDATKVNRISGAIGLGQLLVTGAGAGYSPGELRGPWLNAWLSAAHLAKWRHRCGSWRGAVEVYGGRQTCKTRSSQGAKIVRLWKALERIERKEPVT